MERKSIENQAISTPEVIVGEPIGAGTGTITAKGFKAEAAKQLAETITHEYMLRVEQAAPCYCIDGRPCTSSLADETIKPDVGPSLAGGALVTAYAAAELIPDYFSPNDPQPTYERIEMTSNKLAQATVESVAVGGHIADTAAENTTGCGASDKFLDIMAKPELDSETVHATTRSLLRIPDNQPTPHLTAPKRLIAHIRGYDSMAVATMLPATQIEVLSGAHAELAVVFNYIADTTVDRDRLVAETDQQVFTVDMWYIDKLARALAAGRPDALAKEQELRYAMTAFQVATYLTLCDGTHRPILLTPADTRP